MNSTLKPLVAVVTVVLLGGALAGCTDSEASPPETPSSSTSAPSSPPTTAQPTEPGIDEPTMPKEATQPGKAGVRAQVEFLIEMLNFAMLTGDVSGLRSIGKRCDGCQAYADLYAKTYQRGGAYEDAGWRVINQLIYPVEGKHYSFARIAVAPGRYRERTGADWERIGNREYRLRVVLDRTGDNWSITGLGDAS
jgi:hypothetical protein